jgi:hypothetical protein
MAVENERLENITIKAAEGMASMQRLQAELQHLFAMRNYPKILGQCSKIQDSLDDIRKESEILMGTSTN